ncbi:MAG: hypothetical protein M1837_004253 [Sclerophora amabilis]|nr:MAG: hypothetical protein M1837_004253 [Sclerophora amabilis]
MAAGMLHLPNGQTISVSPVYGGLVFKPNDLNIHQSVFPPGWTIVLHTEDDETDHASPFKDEARQSASDHEADPTPRRQHVHRFKSPTLQHDCLFISAISNPNSSDFKPATSPTRQIAMMLWATLYWYFHQPEPDLRVTTKASAKTAEAGKPKGDWRVNIKREGVLRGRNLLAKLERMGLIASNDSSVGTSMDERSGEGWQAMFMSRRTFWQLDPRIFLFTLSPTPHSPYAGGSPYPSRPASPNRDSISSIPKSETQAEAGALASSQGLWSASTQGPFTSASHLPTYFPPPPLQFTVTKEIRHPVRPKPPRQGETFYTRYIPSIGQYLSFRVVSISPKPPAHLGPTSPLQAHFSMASNTSEAVVSGMASFGIGSSDIEHLHKWMNNPRVAYSWGEDGPRAHQEEFLKAGLRSRHSFPVIGCWDGKAFGYFEIYWVREDRLGRHLENGGDSWDRGLHCLVGEQDYRGRHRVQAWLSSLVHYCFMADYRTQNVFLEPRIDNEK